MYVRSIHIKFRSMLQPEDFTPPLKESSYKTRERTDNSKMEQVDLVLMQ